MVVNYYKYATFAPPESVEGYENMNFSIIFKSLGTLVMLVGLSMMCCMLLGWLIPSQRSGMAISYDGWWLSVAITMLAGGLAYSIGKFRLRGGETKGYSDERQS